MKFMNVKATIDSNILIYAFGIQDISKNKIAREINRFIFFPVKASLETLYKTKLDTGEEEKEEEEKEEETPKKDIYREPIE